MRLSKHSYYDYYFITVSQSDDMHLAIRTVTPPGVWKYALVVSRVLGNLRKPKVCLSHLLPARRIS